MQIIFEDKLTGLPILDASHMLSEGKANTLLKMHMLFLNDLKFQKIHIILVTALRWRAVTSHVDGSCTIFHLL